jgi:SAM-dependent methyltransferase
MRWNTPLSTEHAELLLDRLDLRPGQRIADLGCGWGELLLTAVARAGAGATGAGVDEDAPLLARGRAAAARRGLDDNVTFIEADAAGWRVIHFSEADQREWDDFESTSRAGRQEWLLANAGHPRAPEIREWLDTRERQYVSVYRGLLGFAYLVLAR